MKRRLLAAVLGLAAIISSMPVYAAQEQEENQAENRYAVTLNEEDGFYVVQNPNGGATLSYGVDNGIELLEEEEDGYVYAFKDLSKDGKLDIYEDWRRPVEERVEDLANKLSIFQMAGLKLNGYISPPADEEGTPQSYHIAGITNNFIRFINYGTQSHYETSVKFNNNLQRLSEALDWGIPINLCSDPRNSALSYEEAMASDIQGAGWPTNLAMAATFDPSWALLYGQACSDEYRAIGLAMAVSPQIDLATEPRWRRFSGTFGENYKLASDMAQNLVSGFQSTWSGVGTDSEDLGWGEDSIVTQVKHYPGDGPAEAGRESHSVSGKYCVYPGNNMAEHLAVFDAAFHLPTKTESSKAVMPSYSIAYDEFGPIGQPVGSGYSAYKLQTLLRGELGFDGLIVSDWGISGELGAMQAKPWGVEYTNDTELTTAAERFLAAYKAGTDQIGLPGNTMYAWQAFKAGAELYTTYTDNGTEMLNMGFPNEDGTDKMIELYRESARHAIEVSMLIGLYENPYVSVEGAKEAYHNEEYCRLGYEAQLASVTMLKNKGNIIQDRTQSDTKPTVYIPILLEASQTETSIDLENANATGEWAKFGFANAAFSGYAVDIEVASKYFNVVTDTIREGADMENLKEEDVIRLNDFTDVDFALVSLTNPTAISGYEASLRNLDPENGELDNGYYPISLQYGEYYADPEIVREYPIAVDPIEELEWTQAGGERGRSRYYGGKTTPAAENYNELQTVLVTKERIGDLPLVVYLSTSNPMCFYEFEPQADSIVVGFGVCLDAALEVIAGQYEPNGLLPMQMPADMTTVEQQYEDVAGDMICHVDTEGNEYDFAFGMNWSGVIEDERVTRYQ